MPKKTNKNTYKVIAGSKKEPLGMTIRHLFARKAVKRPLIVVAILLPVLIGAGSLYANRDDITAKIYDMYGIDFSSLIASNKPEEGPGVETSPTAIGTDPQIAEALSAEDGEFIIEPESDMLGMEPDMELSEDEYNTVHDAALTNPDDNENDEEQGGIDD